MPIPRDPERDHQELIARYRIDLRRGLAAPEFWASDPDVPDDLRELPPPGDPRVYAYESPSDSRLVVPTPSEPSAERIAEERAKQDRHENVKRRRAEYLRERFGS